MTVDITQLFLLGLFTASSHWLVARSAIAKPLWSRARGFFGELLSCTGCSGTWLGAMMGALGFHPLISIEPLPFWTHIVAGGVFGAFLTPVFQAVMLWGLERTAIEHEGVGEEETTPRPPKV